MGANTAPERPSVPEGATRNAKTSFKGQLDSGELLSSTPVVTEMTTSDLTISNEALNTSTITVGDDTSVLASQAVQYTVTGQLVANSPYTLKIVVSTDASQTLVAYDVLEARNE